MILSVVQFSSGEIMFKLNDLINRHNSVYWATENPQISIQEELNVPEITVWLVVSVYGLIGSYFFFFFFRVM